MTEQEWLTCTDPQLMLEFLRAKASVRKLRLFQVACCRRIWPFITDSESRAVVEITERSADGSVDVQEILSLDYDRLTDDCGGPEEPYRMAFMVAGHVGYSLTGPIHGSPYTPDDFRDALETARGAVYTMAVSLEEPDDKLARFYTTEELHEAHRQHMAKIEAAFLERQASEQAVQSSLLRCLFGNPFRPVTFDPAWRTPSATAIAQTIYDERRFTDLPILADALEEIGCNCQEILDHCRNPGEHVRGCWVLDLILSKDR
jgi:hypothetical protein